MSTYQLLQLIPERREAGRGLDELLDEMGLDFAYVRFETRQCPFIKPYRRAGDNEDHDDIDEEETVEEFRARLGRAYRRWFVRDWMQWQSRAKSTLTTLSHIYKRLYNDNAITDMTTREHPTFAMIGGSGMSVIADPYVPPGHAYLVGGSCFVAAKDGDE